MRTIYTCPTLMHIERYIHAWKLRKEYRVFWKVYDSESDRPAVKALVAQPLSIPEGESGGWQLSPLHPLWMTKLEMWIRDKSIKVYAHIPYPRQMFKHHLRVRDIRKKQKAYERKKRLINDR